MADNILDQLKAFKESQEASKRTTKEIQDQRDLLKEVARLAKSINLEFNETTKNIGKSADQLKIGEVLEEKLSQSLRDRSSIENSLLSQLQSRIAHEKQIGELQRIQSLTTRDRYDEYTQKIKDLKEELRLGNLNSAQFTDQKNTLLKIYGATGSQLNIQNALLSRANTQITASRNLLGQENIRLDKLKMQNAFMGVGKKLLGDMGPLVSKIINFRSITWWSTLTDIIEKGVENFKLFDKAAVSVRSHLGLLPGQARELEILIKSVGIDTMHLGATFEDVGKSINAIADEFGGLVAQDKNLLTTTTALAKQFGITEAISSKFLKTIGGISGKSTSSQTAMIGFAQKMSAATKIPLGKIMEDVANATDDVRIYVGASAASMIKAATAARMMGIDLNKAAASAQKLLDFESSIASELKASALLGQNVNFNYARQLFFNKNIVAGNKEILRLTKLANFNQLDPIKQKAFADAAGKTVSELQDMLIAEKNMQLVANSTDKNVQRRYQEYQRLMQLKDREAEDEGKIAEKEFLRKANQEKLAQIQNKFNQLMSELAEPVMEVLDGFLTIATELLPYIKQGIMPILGATLLLSKHIVDLGKKFTIWSRAVSIAGSRVGIIVRFFGRLAGYFGPLIKLFGTKIPLIGWIISGFLVIRNYIRDIKRLFDEGGSWGEKIVKGILLIGKAIVEAFLPFESVKNYLDEWFFGKSPSKAGKMIMKGFSSIGPELQDSLTKPISEAYKDIEAMETPEVKVENTATNKLTAQVDNSLISAIQTGNQQLVAKIDQLMTMMANGGIAVNLDGQLVNRALSTNSYKFGGYGQSTSLA